MKHYLVTGGAGFIGSNLIKTLFLHDSGVKITCIDDFDPFYSVIIKDYKFFNLTLLASGMNVLLIDKLCRKLRQDKTGGYE